MYSRINKKFNVAIIGLGNIGYKYDQFERNKKIQTHVNAFSKNNNNYYDTTGHQDALTGGVKLIPIKTDKGTFNVWTKRVGNNPKTKVLLLHGGPGATHEYFECFDSFFPQEGFEYYYYDQFL